MEKMRPDLLAGHPLMWTTLVISTAVHVLIFLGFKDAFPPLLQLERARVYEVELVRPPIEDLEEARKAFGEQASVDKGQPEEPPEILEDTISLDTKDRRYVSYMAVLKGRIHEHWTYPEQAREYLLEGKLLLVFTLSRDGSLIDVRVESSSGHEILDSEASRAVRAAAPYPAFPDHLRVKRLHVQATFNYSFTSQ